MRARVALLAYLACVVSLTFVHDLRVLGAALLLWTVLAGRDAPRLARRAGLAILLFNGTVSAGYIVLGLLRDEFVLRSLLLMNLRVFLITACTFLMMTRVDLFRALSFSRGLVTVLTLAWAQIRVFSRMLEDFRLGLRSRSLRRPGARVLMRHGTAAGSYALEKALHDASEFSLAMQARGFFDERR